MLQKVSPELVEKIKKQDINALGEIYTLLSKKVYNHCFFILKNQDLAEDATQEIFLKLFTHAGGLKDNVKVEAWLSRITYNYCIDVIKKAKKTATSEITNRDELMHFINEVDQINESEDLKVELKNALELLSEKERLIIVLYFWEGLKVHEIADQLELGESAVKMNLKRSKEKLKNRLNKKGINHSLELSILLFLELL